MTYIPYFGSFKSVQHIIILIVILLSVICLYDEPNDYKLNDFKSVINGNKITSPYIIVINEGSFDLIFYAESYDEINGCIIIYYLDSNYSKHHTGFCNKSYSINDNINYPLIHK